MIFGYIKNVHNSGQLLTTGSESSSSSPSHFPFPWTTGFFTGGGADAALAGAGFEGLPFVEDSLSDSSVICGILREPFDDHR